MTGSANVSGEQHNLSRKVFPPPEELVAIFYLDSLMYDPHFLALDLTLSCRQLQKNLPTYESGKGTQKSASHFS